MGSAVLSDEQIDRVEQARREGGPDAEARVLADIEADNAAAEAAALAEDTRSTRERLDDLHREETAATGVPSDVPGVDDDVPGIDPEIGQDADGQFAFLVGGKAPTGHSLVIQGGKIEVGQKYEKGSLLTITTTVRVGGVHFDDKVDAKTKQVVACERKQILKPVSPWRVREAK